MNSVRVEGVARFGDELTGEDFDGEKRRHTRLSLRELQSALFCIENGSVRFGESGNSHYSGREGSGFFVFRAVDPMVDVVFLFGLRLLRVEKCIRVYSCYRRRLRCVRYSIVTS